MKDLVPGWVAAVTGALLLTAAVLLALPPAASALVEETPAARASSLELFFDVYGLARSSYVDTLQSRELVEEALQGMLQSLDPNSVLLTPEELENLQIQLEGSFEGVGITLGQRDGWLTVISPIEGTPAYRGGMKAGDRIVEIDGMSTEGITTNEAVTHIRGPGGTVVELKVVRPGMDEPILFPIERAVIDFPSVSAHFLLEPGLGYVRLSRFSEESANEVLDAVRELENQGAQRMILDLRGNSGGLMLPAIDVADIFLPAGAVVVTTRGQAVGEQTYRTRRGVLYSGDLVLLVDGGSASSSEILAGALQDQGVAVLIGTRTFGKGSVQSLSDLGEYQGLGHYGVKLTTARYYTPNGSSIDRTLRDDFMDSDAEETWGIIPDITVEPDSFSVVLVAELERDGHFFGFAVDYTLEHDIPLDFWPDDSVFTLFENYLAEQEIEYTDQEFAESHRYIERALLREIALREWPMSRYYEVTAPHDTVITTAVEYFSEGIEQ
ncbi:peptidase S41 [Candidatus Fermentibacteria bacterium]|nr:MAG: peptidase S41 [Candidatus Fermentibacteria bacterium]